MEFTINDYMEAIEREMLKRSVTYPKILAKLDEEEKIKIETSQSFQNWRLATVKIKLEYYNNSKYTLTSGDDKCLLELTREYSMRLKCYPRFVYFKRMTQEMADSELTVWKSMIDFYVATFNPDAKIIYKKTVCKLFLPAYSN